MAPTFRSDEERQEFEAWMADVSANAEKIQNVQDELSEKPEFCALVLCAKTTKNRRDVQSVADYAVMYAYERLFRCR